MRAKREWNEVYKIVPTLYPFEGINDIVCKLHDNNIPMCIVTSSPYPYCSRVINQWGWQIKNIVHYHSTTNHKPHPEPILKGIELLGVNPEKVVSIGDDAKDIISSKKAGVISVGVLWGATNMTELIASKPDYLFNNVVELDKFLSKWFNLRGSIYKI